MLTRHDILENFCEMLCHIWTAKSEWRWLHHMRVASVDQRALATQTKANYCIHFPAPTAPWQPTVVLLPHTHPGYLCRTIPASGERAPALRLWSGAAHTAPG